MKYISINAVMDKVMNHPLMQDIPYDTAVGYMVDFIRIMGMPQLFEKKTQILEVEDYRCELPCDYYSMVQIRTDCPPRVLRYATSSFEPEDDYTYTIHGNILHTSIKNGNIEVAYLAMPVDDDGVPLIPDVASFLRALELYIKKEWFTILFDTNKISPTVYENTRRDYAWAVGQAREVLITPTVDQMESISNMWNTLIPRTREHARAFKTLGVREYLKKQ